MSIRTRYSMVVVAVLSLVMILLMAVNATWLKGYTISQKQNRIKETVTVIQEYIRNSYDEDTLKALEKVTDKSNIDIVIMANLDSIPQIVYASDINRGGKSNQLIQYFYGDIPRAIEVYYSSNECMIYKAYDSRLGTYQIDCIGMVDNVGFVMTTPLESIEESARLSNQLLMRLGFFAILLGAVIMFVVTGNITRPIRELSHLSEQMAELNFNVRYQGKQNNEIGVLGESMNHMSDRLQQTIEELQKANEQLAKDLDEKERIDEMRRAFLSNVSHELKTPIALIQGYSEGLKDGISDDPESMEFYADVIIDEARKMNLIVKRLLNLDAIESGNMQMDFQVFDLGEILQGVAQSSRMLAQDRECKLQIDLPRELMVYGDPFMMEQVVQNYMSNAFHYVTSGGVVTVGSLDLGKRYRIYVHNTGEAIPEQDLEHVWEKFYKVDKARTRSYGGSGIGLSIVKAIMHNHNESCGVMNRDDGVEFWFDIKKAQAMEPNEDMN